MTIQVVAEVEVMREASQILLENLSPSKVARFWASWHAGQGDYLNWRDEQFTDETVTSLYEKVVGFQKESGHTTAD